MKSAQVFFNNGDDLITSINGTDKEIKEYYAVGRTFNVGDGFGGDKITTVKRCEVLK
jgi:hypothetical protein